MSWNVVFYGDTEEWLKGLDSKARAGVTKAIDRLQQHGPTLGRPTVDTLTRSQHHNMKELRSFGGHQRVLFAFDRNRNAVLLVGGDKSDRWKSWYRENMPKASRLFEQYKRDRGDDGRWRGRGDRSAGR